MLGCGERERTRCAKRGGSGCGDRERERYAKREGPGCGEYDLRAATPGDESDEFQRRAVTERDGVGCVECDDSGCGVYE